MCLYTITHQVRKVPLHISWRVILIYGASTHIFIDQVTLSMGDVINIMLNTLTSQNLFLVPNVGWVYLRAQHSMTTGMAGHHAKQCATSGPGIRHAINIHLWVCFIIFEMFSGYQLVPV